MSHHTCQDYHNLTSCAPLDAVRVYRTGLDNVAGQQRNPTAMLEFLLSLISQGHRWYQQKQLFSWSAWAEIGQIGQLHSPELKLIIIATIYLAGEVQDQYHWPIDYRAETSGIHLWYTLSPVSLIHFCQIFHNVWWLLGILLENCRTKKRRRDCLMQL